MPKITWTETKIGDGDVNIIYSGVSEKGRKYTILKYSKPYIIFSYMSDDDFQPRACLNLDEAKDACERHRISGSFASRSPFSRGLSEATV